MYSAVLERSDVPKSPRRRIKPDGEEREQEFPRVAEALRAIRKLRDLTQEDMAPVLGLSFAGYRPYERGDRDLTRSQIEMIATGTGVSVFQIMRLLWPPSDDSDESHRTYRFSGDLDEIQREVEDLPDELAERVIRNFKAALEIANSIERGRVN